MLSKNSYSFSKNFSDVQVEQIVRLADGNTNLTWSAIAERLNKRWGLSNSEHVYKGIYRRYAPVIQDLIKKSFIKQPHADFTREALGAIVRVNTVKKKRFFVTGVVAGAKVHEPSLDAVLTYCRERKAELVILPVRAHVKALQDQPLHYDPILKGYKKRFATEFVFNEHLRAMELQINPQQISPLTGMHRIRGRAHELLSEEAESEAIESMIKKHRKISVLIAHTKQDMEPLPTGNSSHPRIIHSTGVISEPNYLLNTRIGRMAQEDHVLGGLIVEIDNDIFHLRQVQFNPKTGSFVDGATAQRFHADGSVSKERAEAMVIGDVHPGHHSEFALNVWRQVSDVNQPKRFFHHDWGDGGSVNPWLKSKKLTRAMRPSIFKDMPTEFNLIKSVLYGITDWAPKDAVHYLVDSNHPDFFTRYLESGDYVNDPIRENYEIAHRMVIAKLEGRDPLKDYIDPEGRFVWLSSEDDIFVENVQCAAHGHIGLGGSKGSRSSNEKVHVNAMTAHEHSPGIKHDLFVVGHSSEERHGYNRGASTWLWCSGLIFKGGHKQLIITINGSWKLS